MREADRTTRQRIADVARDGPVTAGELAARFDVTRAVALDHVQHVARSLREAEEELLVAPPACRDCGFDAFDDPANHPSRCPECRSEAIDEPAFLIE